MDKKMSFEKCLWRACRRTAFVRITEIEEDFVDPLTVSLFPPFLFYSFSVDIRSPSEYQHS